MSMAEWDVNGFWERALGWGWYLDR